ncbi:hypothetical protein bas35_0141 [Escherichia phage WilhelmHis]|jgi:hypothetical protein|uniref:Uncharacterized protein n=4 Tax=Tequatrovirus TaxID=10663 RepID=A0A482N2M1_9CAUD|nr:hypothetical protein [Escherichia coli]YP_009279025.1 hypothetical protein BI057_gp127 [Shigella phage SHFML-26]YP_009618842.1 hypothetical protein FDJ02_gp028 [Shigella phage Sf21]YP_010069325.1 hypothetical protein KMC07_gp028 [Escherichia phage vB_EcoM_G8]AKN44587.1 hypothetical protein PEC04_0100 [Escherichia phage PEC04]QBO61040.1 hypothetical protein D5505_00028 [Escherichia phage D5505]QNI20118.1 hypothetical protein [Enterobacteria phage phiC600P9]QNJ50128.1 hypothetical protein P
MKISKEEFIRRQKALINLYEWYAYQLKVDSSNINAVMALYKQIQDEHEFLAQVFIED